MANFITKYLQARNLREAMMPAPVPEGEEVPQPVLSKDVKSVLVLVDVTDLTWKDIRAKALELFVRRCISGQIVYIYPAKVDKKTILTTPPDQTVTMADISKFGKPVTDKIPQIVNQKPDILINLVQDTSFMMEYIVRVSGARFKIGRMEFEPNAYDMLLKDAEDEPLSPMESFCAMIEYLDKMKWKVL
jgi:hypothetical protein